MHPALKLEEDIIFPISEHKDIRWILDSKLNTMRNLPSQACRKILVAESS